MPAPCRHVQQSGTSQWANCAATHYIARLTTATLQGQHEPADEAYIASKKLHSRAVRPCFIPFINRLTMTKTCSACAWGRTPVGHAERSTDRRCLVYRCMHGMPVLACGVRPVTPQWYTASRLQMASCRAGRTLLLSSLTFSSSLPAAAGSFQRAQASAPLRVDCCQRLHGQRPQAGLTSCARLTARPWARRSGSW
jgi:hypothetical protein